MQGEDRQIRNLNRAVTKDLSQRFVRDQILSQFHETFFEVQIQIGLDDLRAIDTDRDKQAKFLNQRFPLKLENSQVLPFFAMTINIGANDKITQRDIEYINDLLMWQTNRIYIVPLLRFNDETEVRRKIEFYEAFVEKLLEAKNSVTPNLRVGASVPQFYPRTGVENVFDLYENENRSPQFVLVDFGRERISSGKMLGVIPRIFRHFRSEKEEEYFLYGFNVKPHLSGHERPVGEDVGCFLTGLNAIGRDYKMTSVNYFLGGDPTWANMQKMFGHDDYNYHRLTEDAYRNRLARWVHQRLDPEANFDEANSGVFKFIKRYNVFQLNNEATELSQLVRESDNSGLRTKLRDKDVVTTLRNLRTQITEG